MNELGSIVSLIQRECPGAPHEALLVIDAATGQNALEQAREFNKKVALTGLVVTKLDGTPKGGIVVSIAEELGIAVRYLGLGEKMDDLKPFLAQDFVNGLFAEEMNMPVRNATIDNVLQPQKYLSSVAAVLLICGTSIFQAGCATDCVYKSYTTEDGEEGCARVCPLTDEEGNKVLNSNGKVVYEEPEVGEEVHRINCNPFGNINNSTTSSTSSGATATPTG